MKPRLSKLSAKYSLNARSIKQVRNALRQSLARFEDDETIRFRGRALGNEGYINAAVWYFAELDPKIQERVLRTYLGRLEAFLGPAEAGEEAVEGSVDMGDQDGSSAARGSA